MTREDLARRLLATFVQELDEQVQAMTADILALETEPDDAERLKRLFRGAHTLKGAAHAAGVPLIQQACHSLESILAAIREGRAKLAPAEISTFLEAMDALSEAGARLRENKPLDDSLLTEVVQRLLGGRSQPVRRAAPAAFGPPAGDAAAPRDAPASPPAPAQPRADDGSAEERPPDAAADAPAAPRDQAEPGPASGNDGAAAAQLRVGAGKFDALLASVSEVLATSRRILVRRSEAGELQELAARLNREHAAGAGRRRSADGDGGEEESVRAALATLAGHADRLAADTLEDGRALSHAVEQLGARTRALRMRPFSDASEGLQRAVRDLATASGKEARFELSGGEIEVDRAVIDRLRPALLHLVRNAVVHGIEQPSLRSRRGKPPSGTVRVAARVQADRLVVTVVDDGAGLNLSALRQRIGGAGSGDPRDERAVARAVFDAGISTRRDVTEAAGRGVGLDAARAAIESVRGTIDVATESGVGTTFTLEAPLTLALLRVLVVEAGGEVLALPTTSVARLMRVAQADIGLVDGRDAVSTPDGPVPVAALAPLLGYAPDDRPQGALNLLVLTAAERQLALVVDAFLDEEEVLVRRIQRIRPPPANLLGAAVRADGQPVLVLDPAPIVTAGLETRGAQLQIDRAGAARPVRRVLVADDSITTRTLLQGVLESEGYAVTTAADGAEALERLEQGRFDLLVSDVQMPRLDGFDLCQTIRARPALEQLPVILVTGLETPDQRARGLEAGADAYLPKSSFDQEELLDRIRQLLH